MQDMSALNTRFNGFTRGTINFFNEIEANNNKVWFESHKEIFTKDVKSLFQDLASDLNSTMINIDSQFGTRPEKVISRIYRDTRFSRDKSPYKTTMWLTYKRASKNWMDCPAYFFELSGNSYRYGLGYYSAEKKTMDMFRIKIIENLKIFESNFNKIIKDDLFSIEGTVYKKKIPNDLPEEMQTWYQRRNLYLVCNRPIEKDLFSSKLVSNLIKGYEILKPFYHFLRQ